MKKRSSLLFVLLAIVFALSSCEIPFFGEEREPFQPGAVVSGVYVNSQADLMLMVPIGWLSYSGEDAKRQFGMGDLESAISDVKNKNKEDSLIVDFIATNPESFSVVLVAFIGVDKNFSWEKELESASEELNAEAIKQGATIEIISEFDYVIAEKDFKVLELDYTQEGITLNLYVCMSVSGDYASVLYIIPSPIEASEDSFESLAAKFQEI